MNVLSAALKYLARGWSVVPVHVPIRGGGCSCGRECSWPGKHPRVPWRQYTEQLPSAEQVTAWFSDEFYGSNVGIVTGQVSKVVVVDVDGAHEAYRQLGLPRTLEAVTGGGGRHYFYKCKEAVPSRIGMVSGIDVKADGGFVVLPPSLHMSGRRYLWRWTVKPALLDPSDLPAGGEARHNGLGWYGELLDGVAEGERSITAARLAGRYAQLGLTDRECYMLLGTWNDTNTPPLPANELARTIRAVYAKHIASSGSIGTTEELYQLFADLTGRGRR